MGPRTVAWVRRTVSTIFFVDWSMTSWSYAFRRMRIFCFSAMLSSHLSRNAGLGGLLLLDDLGDAAGAHGAATLADREAQALIHGDRVDQLHLHHRVVTRHAHLGALRELHMPGDVRRPEEELRPVVAEE